MRRVLATVLCVTAAVTSAAGANDQPPLDGTYLCVGKGADGTSYSALVELVQYADTYRVRWTFPETGESLIGMGVRRDDVLAVMYLGRDPGLVTYQIEEDATLVGTWTTIGAEGHVFSETLTKTDAPPPDHPGPREEPEPAVPERPVSAPAGLRA